MIKQIPYDLGSKGVTYSAIDFESTAGRLPSPPEPQWAGVLLTSQSPRPEGSASPSPLVAQGNGTGRCKQKVLHPAGETATPRQDPNPASLEGAPGWDRHPVSIASRHQSLNSWRVWGCTCPESPLTLQAWGGGRLHLKLVFVS